MNFVKEKGWVKKITILTILCWHTLATVQTLKRLTNFRYCMTRSAHFSRSSGLRRALPRSIVSGVWRDMFKRLTNFWTHGTDGRRKRRCFASPIKTKLDGIQQFFSGNMETCSCKHPIDNSFLVFSRQIGLPTPILPKRCFLGIRAPNRSGNS